MCFCPPCAYADVTAVVHGAGPDDCLKHCCGLTVCSCCLPCAAAFTRIKIYEKYGIEDKELHQGVKQSHVESAVGCLAWVICPCIPLMFMCQERNQVLLG